MQSLYYCSPQTTAVPVLLSTLNLFWKLAALDASEGSEDPMDLCSSLLFPPDRMVSLTEGPLLLPFPWVNERRTKTMMEAKNCTIRLFIVKSSKPMWWRNITLHNDLWINPNILTSWCWHLIINARSCFLELYFGVSLTLEFIQENQYTLVKRGMG